MGAVSFLRFLGAVLLSLALAVAVLFLLTFVVMQSDNPAKLIFPCVSGATLVGAWFCGLFGAGLSESHKKLFAVLTYAAYLLLILTGSFFFQGEQIGWVWRAILVVCGLTCAFLASCLRRGEGQSKRARASIRRVRKGRYHA